jgi:type II secretory pathway component HofQ
MDTPAEKSLLDKVRELLDESESELASIDERRAQLISERDAEINVVRERYASQLEALDAELRTAQRLRNALTPPRKPGRKPGSAKAKGLDWSPSDKSLNLVLRIMGTTDASTISEITKHTEVSSTTVKNAVDHLRSQGLVRLRGSGPNNAKRYGLTSDGERRASELAGEGDANAA